MLFFRINVFILFFCFITCSFAAEKLSSFNSLYSNKKFEHLSLEDGLSQASAQVIFSDSQGFMWIATTDGLNRYDGYQFRIYRHIPDDDLSISSNDILSIFEDNSGRLWFGSNGQGVNLFDKGKEIFKHFSALNNASSGLSHNTVKSIIEDDNKDVWFGTKKGISYLSESTSSISQFNQVIDSETSLSVSELDVNYLLNDTEKVWIGTNGQGLFYYVLNEKRFYSATLIEQDLIITALLKIDDEHMLIGTSSGIILFNTKSEKIIRNTPLRLLDNNHISGLLLEANNVWIGTKKGGYIYDYSAKSLSPSRFAKK